MLLILQCRNPKEVLKYMNDESIVPTGFVIINYQEWQYNSLGDDPHFNDVVNYINKKNIPLHIINGSAEDSKYLHDTNNEFYKNIQPIISFPIYFLVKWKKSYIERYKEFPTNADSNYTYLFVSLNFRTHYHRCCQIDMLAKYNLLSYGAVSWHGVNLNEKDISYTANYNFKFWKPKELVLDKKNNVLQLNWAVDIPAHYKHSFVQIVSESTDKVKFITEKTVLPLFWGKIFLISGAQGINKYLKKLGFEIFEELFDYSFDDEPDLEKRCDMIAKNIDNLKHLTSHELKDLYNKVYPKLIHNQHRLNSIEKDLSLWPTFIIDMCENNPEFSKEEIYDWYQGVKNVS